jgi:hypothetical protein
MNPSRIGGENLDEIPLLPESESPRPSSPASVSAGPESEIPAQLAALLRTRSNGGAFRPRSPIRSEQHARRRWAELPLVALRPHQLLDGLDDAEALPDNHPSGLGIDGETHRQMANTIPQVGAGLHRAAASRTGMTRNLTMASLIVPSEQTTAAEFGELASLDLSGNEIGRAADPGLPWHDATRNIEDVVALDPAPPYGAHQQDELLPPPYDGADLP